MVTAMVTAERVEKRGSAATVRVSALLLPYTNKASGGSVAHLQSLFLHLHLAIHVSPSNIINLAY
jgi:hypothetical protein